MDLLTKIHEFILNIDSFTVSIIGGIIIAVIAMLLEGVRN